MKSGLKIVAIAINILYPFAVLGGLLFLDAPLRVFVFALAALVIVNVLANSDDVRRGNTGMIVRLGTMILGVAVVVVLMVVTDNAGFAKLYPVIVNFFLLALFSYSLIKPPTVIWRLATMKDKDLADGPAREKAERYCRNVTIVWCAFFIINASISLWTALMASDKTWSIYNGFISYVLMGILFAGEFLIRRRVKIDK